MKKIAIKVEIEVPDDYVIDESDWTLEEAIRGDFEYSTQKVAVSQEENSDEEYIRKVIQALKRCPVKTWRDIGDEDATEKDIEDIQVKFIQDTLEFFKEDNDEEDTMVSLEDVHQFLIDYMYEEMDYGDYSYGNYEVNWTDLEDRKSPNPLIKLLDLLDKAVVKK